MKLSRREFFALAASAVAAGAIPIGFPKDPTKWKDFYWAYFFSEEDEGKIVGVDQWDNIAREVFARRERSDNLLVDWSARKEEKYWDAAEQKFVYTIKAPMTRRV